MFRACLHARADFATFRQSIEISDLDRDLLYRMAGGTIGLMRLEAVLAFRAATLEEFDRLVASQPQLAAPQKDLVSKSFSRPRVSQARVVLRLARDGEQDPKIAELHRQGIARSDLDLPENLAAIQRLYASGVTCTEIAKKFQCTRPTITKLLHHNGISKLRRGPHKNPD
jgi:hypothetical protein